MRVNISATTAMAMGDELFSEPKELHRPRPSRHAVPRIRQRWPLCPVSGKRRLTEHAAHMHLEAVQLLGRNEPSEHLRTLKIKRAYRCVDCGDYHLTSKR